MANRASASSVGIASIAAGARASFNGTGQVELQSNGPKHRLAATRRAKKKNQMAASGSDDIKPLELIDRVPRMLQAPELVDGLPFAEDEVEVEAGG